jgi:ATP-dependent helicase HrpB
VSTLPIHDVLPALLAALGYRSVAVLEAPPGAGKTTVVPLALLDQPWLSGQRVLMLEPRRLAARAAASYMSRTLRESVGQTVGYRVRGESRVSARTRVEIVTEGVLTRMLATDPLLEGVGAVLFDEFHERSLNADLGLALTLQTQSLLRPELRVIVMSATLDGDAVARLIADERGDAPVVRSSGRMFPVATEYRAPRDGERMESHVVRVLREVLQQHEGDVLVFLPGAREIRRSADLLADVVAMHNASRVSVHQLFGMMPLAAQDAAIAPAPAGERKIVLATSIAQTSLTIEGVRVVVDAGRERLPRFDPRVGLSRLETVRESHAAAEQRRGRAGRVAPGVCYRLWDEHEQAMLPPRTRPEILDADLAPLALDLADAGVTDAASLRWLDVPSPAALAQSRSVLRMLGALDDNDRISAHGRAMSALPVHPRLAHLLLQARARGEGMLGAVVAACVEERDFLRGAGRSAPADLRLRVELVQGGSASAMAHDLHGATVDRDAVRRVRDTARDLAQRADVPWREQRENSDACGALLALAFPDRVAQQRSGQRSRYILRNGTGASLPPGDALDGTPFLAIAELDGAPLEYRIVRATAVTEGDVRDTFADDLKQIDLIDWDDSADRIRARRQTQLGALVLHDAPLRDVPPDVVHRVLLDMIRSRGIAALPWSRQAARLRERLAFVHAHDALWPDVTDDALHHGINEWLGPSLHGVTRFSDIHDNLMHEALLSLLDWSRRAALDRLAPTHIVVPSGSQIAVDYSDPAAPVLAVKLQEVFGWTSTPTICDGRVPLTLHLLSPAQRPVQVTRDLAGFWRDGYFDVRKELRGRYPRHPWPDDPLSAEATRRAKPR